MFADQVVITEDAKSVIPKGARLLVERAPAEERSGSFVIPDEAKQKTRHGTVIAAGAKVTDPDLQPGARVVFGAFSGNTIRFRIRDSDEIVMLNENDILGVLPKDGR